MKLYEINAEIEKLILGDVNTDTGEFSSDLESKLSGLQFEKSEKVLNIACLIKSLEAEASAHAEEEKHQKRKKQILKNRAGRLKEFLKSSLNVGNKFKDPRISVAYRQSGSKKLVIDDILSVPFEYMKQPELDKSRIRDHVIEHPEVKFAHLEDSEPSLVIK